MCVGHMYLWYICVCVEFKVHIRHLPLFHLKFLRQGFSWNPTYSFSWTSWSAAPHPVLLLTPQPAKCSNYFFTHKPPSMHSNKLTNGDIFLNPASTRISKWIPVMQNEAVYEMGFCIMVKWPNDWKLKCCMPEPNYLGLPSVPLKGRRCPS